MRTATLKTRQRLFEALQATKSTLIVKDNGGTTVDRYSLYFVLPNSKQIVFSSQDPDSATGVWQYGEYFDPAKDEDKQITLTMIPDAVAKKAIEELHG